MKYFIITLGVAVLIGGGALLALQSEEAPQTQNENEPASSETTAEENEEAQNNNTSSDSGVEVLSLLQKSEDIESLKYDVMMDAEERTTSGTFWQKEEKIRMEGEVEGQETVSIIDNKEKIAYLYIPAQNFATKVSFGEVEQVQNASMKKQTAEITNNQPVFVGEEVIDGKECVVIRYTTDDTTTKTWVWKEHGLPIKMESEKANGELTVTTISNIEFDTIPDSVFQLPEDVEVTEMPDMPDMLNR